MRLKSLFGIRGKQPRGEERGEQEVRAAVSGGEDGSASSRSAGTPATGRARTRDFFDTQILENSVPHEGDRSRRARPPAPADAPPPAPAASVARPEHFLTPEGVPAAPPAPDVSTTTHPPGTRDASAAASPPPFPVPQAVLLPGGGRAATKGDGLPWYDDEEEDRMPTLDLGEVMATKERSAASRKKRSFHVDRDVADEAAFADLARNAASFNSSHDGGRLAQRKSRSSKAPKRPGRRDKAKQAPTTKRADQAPAKQHRHRPVPPKATGSPSPPTESAGVGPPGVLDPSLSTPQRSARTSPSQRKLKSPPAGTRKGTSDPAVDPSKAAPSRRQRETAGVTGSGSPRPIPRPPTRVNDAVGAGRPAATLPLGQRRKDPGGDGGRLHDQPDSLKNHAVRQVVESAYADALQEEARGPGGGLRRIVELLRQNERNRLAVENVAIAIAVLSENDCVACDAFGNHGALEVLLHCIVRYDGSSVVTKRLCAALRALVAGSRRNGRLFEAHDGVKTLSLTACSTRFQDEPGIAVDALRTLAVAMTDSVPKAAAARAASDGLSGGVGRVERGSSPRAKTPSGRAEADGEGHAPHPISPVICSVTMAMDLHEHRVEVQEAGLHALRTLLTQVEKGKLSTSDLSDVVESVGAAFRLHASESSEVCWLSLALLCDVDAARESHLRVDLDLECFFGSLRHVVSATELETGAAEEAGARLVTRALQVTTHIGWRSKETQQDIVNAGAVDACLDVLRVFRSRADVLEAVCGLAHGLLDSPEARVLIEVKSQAFLLGILTAISDMTQSD